MWEVGEGNKVETGSMAWLCMRGRINLLITPLLLLPLSFSPFATSTISSAMPKMICRISCSISIPFLHKSKLQISYVIHWIKINNENGMCNTYASTQCDRVMGRKRNKILRWESYLDSGQHLGNWCWMCHISIHIRNYIYLVYMVVACG